MGDGRQVTASGDAIGGQIVVSSERGSLVFEKFTDIVDFSVMMAKSDKAIPAFMRTNPGACMAVTIQANEWGFSPFAVARMAYVVNDQIAYMSQLIHAVVEKRAPIKGRLRVSFTGEGQDRQAIIVGHFREEVDPCEYVTPKVKDIKVKNSPLWTSDPDQQLFYYGSRAWARRYCPDVILGVYASDELPGHATQEHIGADRAKDVTPLPDEQPLHHRLSMKAAVSAGFDAAGIAATMSEVSGHTDAPSANTNSSGVAPGGEAAAKDATPRASDGEPSAPAQASSAAADHLQKDDGSPPTESSSAAAADSHIAAAADPAKDSLPADSGGSSAQAPPAPEAGAEIGESCAPAEPAPFVEPALPTDGSGYVAYVRAALKNPELQAESAVRLWWGSFSAKRFRNDLPNLTKEIMEEAKAIVAGHIEEINQL